MSELGPTRSKGRPGGLRRLLVGRAVAIVLLAVVVLSLAAAGLMRGLAVEETLQRVRLAGIGAESFVLRQEHELESAAAQLAAEPILATLVRQSDTALIERRLQAALASWRLTGVALLQHGVPIASCGASQLPVFGSGSGAGRIVVVPGPAESALLIGASAPLRDRQDSQVVAGRALDPSAAAALGRDLGVEVRFLAVRQVSASSGTALDGVRTRALLEKTSQKARLPDGSFVAVNPVLDGNNVLMLVEARLEAQTMRELLGRFLLYLLGIAALVAAVAAVSGAALARRLGGDLDGLTRAAAAIREGNLYEPVAIPAPGEIAALGTTMEEMRRALLDSSTELHRREHEARAMVDEIVEGVFTVDRDRRLVDLNAQAAKVLGIDLDSARGRFCGDLLDPIAADGSRPCETDCPILSARESGRAQRTETLRRPDGPRRTVVITSAAPSAGRQIQLMRDETEVEAARRARDSVLANISHEFKTPLAAQLASLELLLDRLDTLTHDQIRDLVESQHRGALRLDQLIDNLLESVRIEAGRAVLRRVEVQLDALVEEAIETLRPVALLREQETSFEVGGAIPALEGDPARLRQVLINLLANAYKFAPSGSTIAIRIGSDAAGVRLAIANPGRDWPSGFDAESIEAFRRGSGDEPDEPGVGLGLWIARSVVERHGGRLELSREGGNSVAIVQLPVGPPASEKRSKGRSGGSVSI